MDSLPAHRIQEWSRNQPGTSDEGVLHGRERLDQSGILVIDKPVGLTSMDVIRVLRRVSKAKKIGHGGTLDPFATGVLPILFNQATKVSDQIMNGKKEYEGVFILGVAYDTQDVTGTPLSEAKPIPSELDLEAVRRKAAEFVGIVHQTPPMYSAVKKEGRPLYEYAREGKVIEVTGRDVVVEAFEITERIDAATFRFWVRCQKGVYVRTLIHDLGASLGLGAVTKELVRTQTHDFHLDEAVQLSTLKFVSDIKHHLKPLRAV